MNFKRSLIPYYKKIRHFFDDDFTDKAARNGWRARSDQKSFEFYWNSKNIDNRKQLIQILLDTLKSNSSKYQEEQLNILEFGCYSGINLKMISEALSNPTVVGIDINSSAIQFATSRIKNGTFFSGDDEVISDILEKHGARFSLSFVNAVFYCMSEKRVENTLASLVRYSDAIVIGDHIENVDGTRTECNHIDGVYFHPFKKMLKEIGMDVQNIIPAAEKRKALSGFIVAAKHSDA